MTRRTLGVVLAGMSLVGVAGRVVAAQVVQAGPVGQAGQKVTAQIVQPDQEDEFVKGAVSFKTPGLVQPKLIRSTHPKYTPAALRAKIQGDVKIEAIIGVDGRVEKARVKEPLDPELDEEALKALDGWLFVAGSLNDQPVRVLVHVDLTFRMR